MSSYTQMGLIATGKMEVDTTPWYEAEERRLEEYGEDVDYMVRRMHRKLMTEMNEKRIRANCADQQRRRAVREYVQYA